MIKIKGTFNERKECEMSKKSIAGVWPAELQEKGSNRGGGTGLHRDHTQVMFCLLSQ